MFYALLLDATLLTDPTRPYPGSAPPSSLDCLLYTAFVASRLLRLVLPGSLSFFSAGHVNDPLLPRDLYLHMYL